MRDSIVRWSEDELGPTGSLPQKTLELIFKSSDQISRVTLKLQLQLVFIIAVHFCMEAVEKLLSPYLSALPYHTESLLVLASKCHFLGTVIHRVFHTTL